MELPVAVEVRIKTVDKQAPPELPDEAELTPRVVLVQLETPVVQQLDLCRAMVLICKAVHLVTKLTQKAAAAVVVVTTVAVAVPIKLQVEDQKMAAAEVAPATLILHAEL
jgi:hypothetical protein